MKLTVVGHRTTTAGVAILAYVPAGPMQSGSFERREP